MLKVENISKSLSGKCVLQEVSFVVKKSEIVALLGENGAGKSTLLRIISGFIDADNGQVVIDDLEPKDREIYLNKIGYVQEVSSLYAEMSVYDFLYFSANLRKIKESEIDNRIYESVEMLDLHDVLMQKTDTLSKGFKKRLELAAVLLSRPEVLLLDEPTEGLDPNQKSTLRKIIKEYSKNHIIIISTHTLEDVEALASQVLLLHKGKLMANKPLCDFKKEADNSLLASFQRATKL